MRRGFKFPYFILLFPCFFVLHGFTENFSFVSSRTAVLLAGIYLAVAMGLTALFYLLTKRLILSAFISTLILFIQFFFGYIHDFLRSTLPFLSRYMLLVPIILAILAFVFFALRKRKDLSKLSVYLNSLFILLIIFDTIILLTKATKETRPGKQSALQQNSCKDCLHPDIYLVILDEYAGKEQLKNAFGFDNSEFLRQLETRGFQQVVHSTSNYTSTPYSIATILNMQYLDTNRINRGRTKGSRYALELINRNALVDTLLGRGYQFYNFSIFEVGGQAPAVGSEFLTTDARLITDHTFTSRFQKDVLLNLANRWGWEKFLVRHMFKVNRDNEQLTRLTIGSTRLDTVKPKFVLTHLMMPHAPYYFDSLGKLREYQELKAIGIRNKAAYLDNLKHTNKTILSMMDSIQQTPGRPRLIILMSDHGFRYDYQNPPAYAFSNLQSVFIPAGSTIDLPDSVSAVQFVPLILNTIMKLSLPLEDSAVYYYY